MNHFSQNHERGNILFLILLAVVLFAALSYAVTSSMRGGGKNGLEETAKLDSAISDNCTALIENSIDRLKLGNGCSSDQISYELSSGGNANPDAPLDKSCHLFHPNGGDVTPCGPYASVTVTTGIITGPGDTSTIVLTTSGAYLRCDSWVSTSCFLLGSADGVSFGGGQGKLCIRKGDGSDSGRATNFDATTFQDEFCAAACGAPDSVNGYLNNAPSGTVSHYLENDNSLSVYTGACTRVARVLSCNCF